jgi:hypothetical protein
MSNQHKVGQLSVRARISFAVVGVSFVAATAAIIYLARTIDAPETSLAYATWALTFITLVLAIGIPITIWSTSKENDESNKRFLAQEQDRFYAQLDSIYLDIQKMIIEYPHLADPGRTRGADEEIRYQAFAFIVWNFIESIYDYTREGDATASGGTNTLLGETWECIIRHEGTLHAKWFNDPDNQQKFKDRFSRHMALRIAEWARLEPKAVKGRQVAAAATS